MDATVRKIRNQDARKYVADKEPFRGSDLFAEKGKDYYIVYSFGMHVPILICANNTWFENITPAAARTRKHLEMVRPVGAAPYRRVQTEMQKLAARVRGQASGCT